MFNKKRIDAAFEKINNLEIDVENLREKLNALSEALGYEEVWEEPVSSRTIFIKRKLK